MVMQKMRPNTRWMMAISHQPNRIQSRFMMMDRHPGSPGFHDDGQAPGLAGFVHQFVPERPQCVTAQLEQLDAERDSDNGDAHQQPHDEIDDGHEDAPEDEPEDISDGVHDRLMVSIWEKSSMMQSAPTAARSAREALP